jgi:type II secretory pathway pseudopilin PulG
MELMTVVCIISLIAAIAVPAWLEMQWRSKRVELDQNCHAIIVSEEAYHYSFDMYLNVNQWLPTGVPGKKRKAWPTGTLFDKMGYRPDGTVYGQYNAYTGGSCADLNIEGKQNLDALGSTQAYGCCINGEQHIFSYMHDGLCGFQYDLNTW